MSAWLLTAASLLAAVVMVVGGSPTPAAASTTYNQLISGNSLPNQSKCLTLYGFNYDDGAAMVQWDCWNGPDQNWFLRPVGDYVNVVSLFSNKCLDVYNYSLDNNAAVVMYTCNLAGASNQEWRVVSTGNNDFVLKARHSNKCLDVFAYRHNNGASVVQWDCLYGPNQKWHLG